MNTPQPSKNPTDKADTAFRLQSIEKAVDLYGLRLLHFIQGYTHDHDQAEEILQMLWLNVLENFPTSKILQFGILKKKARQILIDSYRASARRYETFKSMPVLPEIDGGYVFAECASSEEESQLRDAFWSNFRDADLTEEQKDAFWLKERYGYTIIDISKHLHVPASTIGEWINKVKRECAIQYTKESI